MATPKKPRNSRPEVPVVRREPAARKRLDPALEAFARGESDRLPRRPRLPQEPRLHDPRISALIPGVANRDARVAADARIGELERLLRDTSPGARGQAIADKLAEAEALGLHRGRSLTAFDALTTHVLGLEDGEVESLLEAGRPALGLGEHKLSEAGVAALLRSEAALREMGFEGFGRIRRDEKGREHLVLDVAVKHAPESLEAIGRRMSTLARDKRGV